MAACSNIAASAYSNPRDMDKKGDWTRRELEEEILPEYPAITIQVNVRFEGKNAVLDLSEVKKLVLRSRLISLANCGCRERVGRCDGPLEVCISLGSEAKKVIKEGIGRRATVKEPLDALDLSHRAGLVHLAYVSKGKTEPQVILSCCSCCCHSMSALVRFGYDDAVVASKYVAVQDEGLCNDCGLCVDRCQFKVRFVADGKLVFDQSKCFGCGVCLSSCAPGTMSLKKRGARSRASS